MNLSKLIASEQEIYFRGVADGFNMGADILDTVLGRKPGKKLTWKQAEKAIRETEKRAKKSYSL